ncbi:MAG: hypothetical protein EB145_15885 [Proteobacteria bacterium]|nr:hypothetical protein [Pseudomonadota bacterium]
MLPEWSPPAQPIALLAGAEGDGLTDEARRLADITVSIPVIPLGDDQFAFEASIARATFTRDAGGRGASFVFQVRGEGPGTTWQLVRDG